MQIPVFFVALFFKMFILVLCDIAWEIIILSANRDIAMYRLKENES